MNIIMRETPRLGIELMDPQYLLDVTDKPIPEFTEELVKINSQIKSGEEFDETTFMTLFEKCIIKCSRNKYDDTFHDFDIDLLTLSKIIDDNKIDLNIILLEKMKTTRRITGKLVIAFSIGSVFFKYGIYAGENRGNYQVVRSS